MESEMQRIERMAAEYAQTRGVIAFEAQEMEAEIRKVKDAHIRRILRPAAKLSAIYDGLSNAIDANREQFKRPKTRIFSGIKVGFRKLKGRLRAPNPEATMKLIRQKFTEAEAEVLIRTTYTLDMAALERLTVQDLKAIGVEVGRDSDVVVVKPVDGDVEKFVAALLAEAEQQEAA